MSIYDRKNIVYRVDFPNGKSYVGVTSYNLNYRKREHFYKVRRGSKTAFHCALRKYWKHNKWSILGEYETFDCAKKKEIELIKSLDTRAPHGYNLTTGGDGIVGQKFSLEYRKKLSEAHMGYVMPQSQKDNISKGNFGIIHKDAKPLVGTNIKTGQVIKFDSITKVRDLGFDRVLVWKCCNGQRKTHKGHKWSFVNQENK